MIYCFSCAKKIHIKILCQPLADKRWTLVAHGYDAQHIMNLILLPNGSPHLKMEEEQVYTGLMT